MFRSPRDAEREEGICVVRTSVNDSTYNLSPQETGRKNKTKRMACECQGAKVGQDEKYAVIGTAR